MCDVRGGSRTHEHRLHAILSRRDLLVNPPVSEILAIQLTGAMAMVPFVYHAIPQLSSP